MQINRAAHWRCVFEQLMNDRTTNKAYLLAVAHVLVRELISFLKRPPISHIEVSGRCTANIKGNPFSSAVDSFAAGSEHRGNVLHGRTLSGNGAGVIDYTW